MTTQFRKKCLKLAVFCWVALVLQSSSMTMDYGIMLAVMLVINATVAFKSGALVATKTKATDVSKTHPATSCIPEKKNPSFKCNQPEF